MNGAFILDDEEKKQSSCDTKSARDCYFIWNFLKQQRDNFDKLFVIPEGIQPADVQFKFISQTYSIYCATSNEYFSKVQKRFDSYIDCIQIKEFLVNTPIDVRNHILPKNGKLLRQKYSDKYDVSVTDNVDVFQNKQYVKDGHKTRAGGAGVSEESNNAYTVKFKGPRKNEPGEETRAQKYIVVVTGIGKIAEIAAQKIQQDIDKYQVTLTQQALGADTIEKMKNLMVQKGVSENTNVVIDFVNGKLQCIGKAANILKARQALNDTITAVSNLSQHTKIELSIENLAVGRHLQQYRKSQFELYQKELEVAIAVSMTSVVITGTANRVALAKTKVAQFIQAVTMNHVTKQIDDQMQCEILEEWN